MRLLQLIVKMYRQCHVQSPWPGAAGELPAHRRLEEVAVGHPHVGFRRGAAAAAQHHLSRHELAVVFAEAAFQRAKAGVGQVGAGGPLPDVAEQLLRAVVTGRRGDRLQVIAFQEVATQRLVGCRHFPLGFAG